MFCTSTHLLYSVKTRGNLRNESFCCSVAIQGTIRKSKVQRSIFFILSNLDTLHNLIFTDPKANYHLKNSSNQIFHYIPVITSMGLMSLRTYLRVIAPACNTAHFKEISQRWRAVDNTVSNLTGPRFEPQTYSFNKEHVTDRSTNWPLKRYK